MKYVFKFLLKMSIVDRDLINSVKAFQNVGAATEKAPCPLRLKRACETVKSKFWEESFIYSGAWLYCALYQH